MPDCRHLPKRINKLSSVVIGGKTLFGCKWGLWITLKTRFPEVANSVFVFGERNATILRSQYSARNLSVVHRKRVAKCDDVHNTLLALLQFSGEHLVNLRADRNLRRGIRQIGGRNNSRRVGVVFEDEFRCNASDRNRMGKFSKRICAGELVRTVKHDALERGRILLEMVGPFLPSEPHAVNLFVLPASPDVGFGQQLKNRPDTFSVAFVQQDRAKCNAESERSSCGLG